MKRDISKKRKTEKTGDASGKKGVKGQPWSGVNKVPGTKLVLRWSASAHKIYLNY
jgi:hypothetical protein